MKDEIMNEQSAYTRIARDFKDCNLPESVWDFVGLYADAVKANRQTFMMDELWYNLVMELK